MNRTAQDARRRAFVATGGQFRADVTAFRAWSVTATDGRHGRTGQGQGEDLGVAIDRAITAAEGLLPVRLAP